MTDTVVTLLSPEQASRYAGGRLVVDGRHDITGVVVDSRQVEQGFLFVALPGSRVDGHDFIPQALKQGAVALIVSSSYWNGHQEQLTAELEARPSVSLIVVENTLCGLQAVAKAYLRQFPDLMRIGITGSNGKTTTKEILGTVISLDRQTVISQGNLNSEIGLPLSCFRVRSEHRCSVFELGINHPGEMDVLADIYRPDVALVTNIGTAHIGFLGSREAIAREKKRIFQYFDGPQRAFIYEEDQFRKILTEGLRGKIQYFGPKRTKGFNGSEDLGLDGTDINWEGFQIRFPLFGAHNLLNALASISVSAELGISKELIKEGLEAVRPLFGRSQILRGSVTVIQDCYNANPESFSQVFRFVTALNWPGRKIAVLGAMKELGEKSAEAHRQVGALAAGSDLQGLFLFGEEMESAFQEIRNQGFAGTADWMVDFDSLRSTLRSYIREGDLLLLKGSRAAELERILPDFSVRGSNGS